jgi:hypothetical protein
MKELQMNKLIVALIAGAFAAVASAQTTRPSALRLRRTPRLHR